MSSMVKYRSSKTLFCDNNSKKYASNDGGRALFSARNLHVKFYYSTLSVEVFLEYLMDIL